MKTTLNNTTGSKTSVARRQAFHRNAALPSDAPGCQFRKLLLRYGRRISISTHELLSHSFRHLSLLPLVVLFLACCAETSHAQISTLVNFNFSNGYRPYGSLTLSGSTLYGTTSGGITVATIGGTTYVDGLGSVFSLPVSGGTPTTIANLGYTNGYYPTGDLTLIGSTLYGTTWHGGANNDGVVFSMPVTGGTPTPIASFSGTNGAGPAGSLTLIGNTLYGTTQSGGATYTGPNTGYGTVFSVPVTGGTPTTIASFSYFNGAYPSGSLTLIGSTLYGTTTAGGANNYGAVFSVPVSGGTPTVIASFTGINGVGPYGSLTVIGNTLYGTTSGANAGNASGNGTVFSVPVTGGTPTAIASFSGTNGAAPRGSLTLIGNTLYGTTAGGGASSDGTVFSVPVSGGTPTVIASFTGTNGQFPAGSLTRFGNTLYGTTAGGGARNYGTVFSVPLPTSGNAIWAQAQSGNWSTQGNWMQGTQPASGIDSFFETGSPTPYTVTLTGASTVKSLTIPGDNVTLALAGNALSVGEALTIDGFGSQTGSLALSGPGSVTDTDGHVGYTAGSIGTATVTGGTWSNSNYLYVGQFGNGTLNLTGSGMVSVSSGTGMVTLANAVGSAGTLNLGTGGTAGTLNAAIVTGGSGTAVVNFNQTGSYTFAPQLTGNLSVNKLGTGTTTLTASNSYSGGTTINTGTLQLNSGGSINGSASMRVGDLSGDNGSLLIFGGSVANGTGYLGYSAGAAGTVTVTGGSLSDSGFLYVGYSGTGILNINGGTVTDSYGYLGNSSGSLGTATVSSGTWSNAASLTVGWSGTGTLNINGGTVTDSYGYLGDSSGSVGTATVTSGTWSNAYNLVVGYSGTGTLNISGGTVTDSYGYLGGGYGSVGTATVTSGTWSNAYNLFVGYSRTGTLNISGGTVTDSYGYLGYNAGSTGTATVSSGTWSNSNSLYIGRSGTGTLNLSGSGVVIVSSGTGTVTLGQNAGSRSTLNIGTGGDAGKLNAAIITGGSGSATVNFNNTGTNSFAPRLTGTMTVNKLGAGITTLTASNSYTGATNVNAGMLAFDVSEKLTGGLNIATSGTAVLTAHSGGAANVKVLDLSSLTISGTTPFAGAGDKAGNAIVDEIVDSAASSGLNAAIPSDVRMAGGSLGSSAPVPEPGTVGLLAAGAIGGLLLHRRNRKSG